LRGLYILEDAFAHPLNAGAAAVIAPRLLSPFGYAALLPHQAKERTSNGEP